MRNLSLSAALVAIWATFAIASPAFFSPRNVAMLSIELSITAVLALGMLLVLLPGQIDLSVGSGVGLVGGISSVLIFRHSVPAPLAMAIGFAAAIALSTTMGTIIVKARLPAFIVTLGGLLVLKGLFWLVITNATVPVVRGSDENALSLLTTYFIPTGTAAALTAAIVMAHSFLRIRARQRRAKLSLAVKDLEVFVLEIIVTAQAAALLVLALDGFRGVPLSLVLLAATAFAVDAMTRHLAFGRYLYAIGDNEHAARLSGVPVERTIILAFACLGAIVALTGLLQTAYSGAATTTVGDLMELDAIAACVIGGTSLRGGRGKVSGVLFGALIMASLLNGMTLLALAPEVKLIARGSVLMLAVWLDVAVSRRMERAPR